MAYGIDTNNLDGKWLVFDFGGGTFDVALMGANEGIMKVLDTEGDNHLGGKNIDLAIVDEIIMPYLEENYSIDNILSDEARKTLLRNALKSFAEETKISLSPKDNNKYDVLSNVNIFLCKYIYLQVVGPTVPMAFLKDPVKCQILAPL